MVRNVIKVASCWLILMLQHVIAADVSIHILNKFEGTSPSPSKEHLQPSTSTTSVPSATQRTIVTVPNLRMYHSVLGLGAVIPDVAIIRFIPMQNRTEAAARAWSGGLLPIGNTSVYYSVSQLKPTSPMTDTGNKWWAYQITGPQNASASGWGLRPLSQIRHITQDGRLLLWVTINGEQALFTPEAQSQGYKNNSTLLQVMGTKSDIYVDPTTWFKPLCMLHKCETMTSNLEPAPVDDWYPMFAHRSTSKSAAPGSRTIRA